MDWKDLEDYDPEKRHLYYASSEWGELKKQVKLRSNGVCEVCNANPARQTHHLTYRRLYHERLSDLQDICLECHRQKHPHHFTTENTTKDTATVTTTTTKIKEDRKMTTEKEDKVPDYKKFIDLVYAFKNFQVGTRTNTADVSKLLKVTTKYTSVLVSSLRHMGFLDVLNVHDFNVTTDLKRLADKSREELKVLWCTFANVDKKYKHRLETSELRDLLKAFGFSVPDLQKRQQHYLVSFYTETQRTRVAKPKASKAPQADSQPIANIDDELNEKWIALKTLTGIPGKNTFLDRTTKELREDIVKMVRSV